MKKIWIWLDNKDILLLSVLVFGIICFTVGYGIGYNKHKISTPVERINIDSMQIVNSYIEERINKIDSVKHDWKEKADSLDDAHAVELFWELLSDN